LNTRQDCNAVSGLLPYFLPSIFPGSQPNFMLKGQALTKIIGMLVQQAILFGALRHPESLHNSR